MNPLSLNVCASFPADKSTNSLLYWRSSINFIIKTSLFLIIICALVPLSPKMPAPGLDPSWALGLNQAVEQGLAFGKDIIFTLGPYSSIYTKAYHPATDLMMISGSLFLACCYWFCMILLMKDIKWRWTVAFGICLLGMIYARDSLFFSYPLLVGLVCCKNINFPISGWRRLISLLLFAPFGLLPLIKGSILILCISVILLCALFFIAHKKYLVTFMGFASAMITMGLFWTGAGQSLTYLPSYLASSLSIASAFTQAMASDGNFSEVIYYLMAMALILMTIAWQKQTSLIEKIFLWSLFFVFLFLSFKTGFTRHEGHAYIAGTSILIAALLLPYCLPQRAGFNPGFIPVLLFSIYTSSYIDGHYTQISLGKNFVSTYSSAWYGLKKRIFDNNWLKQNFNLSLDFLQNQTSFPMISGRTDIYSYNQADLIAAKINWAPRPIFQSYSVFTSLLAEENKNYLLSANRPDTIIFKVEPIDQRIPALEDGASWPVLIANYQPRQWVNGFLLLMQNTNKNPQSHQVQLINKERHQLGDIVTVPNKESLLFVKIDIKPTFWGRFITTIFKPHPLQMTLELSNGQQKQFRIIANMTKSGFLLSPLIENTNEFALLYHNSQLLDSKTVRSFSISSIPNKTWQWQDEYQISFMSLNK